MRRFSLRPKAPALSCRRQALRVQWRANLCLFQGADFLYARRTLGLVTALCAASLLAFAPYLVETSHDLLTDMPAVELMLAAMWLFDKSGAACALLTGVAYALAIETRFTSLFLMLYFLLEVVVSPLVDRSVWPEVQIAQYLRNRSTPADTVYAAHNFPVLAFYSEHRTVSPYPFRAISSTSGPS